MATIPLRFSYSDPLLVRVRELALQLPGAQEKVSVGFPAFYTRKVFVWYGMAVKNAAGVWQHPPSVSLLLPKEERQAVLAMPDSFVPGYIGPHGWVGLRLTDDTDWVEVAELIEESFRATASKKLVRMLESGDFGEQ